MSIFSLWLTVLLLAVDPHFGIGKGETRLQAGCAGV